MPYPRRHMSKTMIFAAVTAAAVIICAAVYAVLRSVSAGGTYATIMTDGEVFAVIDLNDYTNGRSVSLTVPSEYSGGENIIEISDGRISVVSASCPDKVCISQGARGIGCDNSAPIVCLPNRLTVTVSSENADADASSGI